jgi:hypothetical protein
MPDMAAPIASVEHAKQGRDGSPCIVALTLQANGGKRLCFGLETEELQH